MFGGVHRLAHTGDVAGDPGGGFILAGQHGLDLVLLVRPQYLLVALERHALAPLDLDDFHVVAEPLRHVDPQVTELPEARGKHLVARRQRVGQRRLPGSGAGRREDEYLTIGGLEHLLQILEQTGREFREFGGTVVFHRDDHRSLHPVGNVRRAGDEQKITAWYTGSHRSSPHRSVTQENVRRNGVIGGSGRRQRMGERAGCRAGGTSSRCTPCYSLVTVSGWADSTCAPQRCVQKMLRAAVLGAHDDQRWQPLGAIRSPHRSSPGMPKRVATSMT